MAGTGPAPKGPTIRRRSNTPTRGEWQPTAGIGWQHGEIPKPPARLTRGARTAWDVWMHAWFASHWSPDDLPMLRQLIRLFDAVERGTAIANERVELRHLVETFGITPKGQQDRRWIAPAAIVDEEAPAPVKPPSAYGSLKVVNE